MAILLAICLLIGILPSNAFAYGETGTFDATGGMVTYEVLADDTIAEESFRDNETLVSVKFPAHLTTIELYAFDTDFLK